MTENKIDTAGYFELTDKIIAEKMDRGGFFNIFDNLYCQYPSRSKHRIDQPSFKLHL